MSTLKEPQAGKGQTRAEARMSAIGVANNTLNNIRYIYINAHGQDRKQNENDIRGVWKNIIKTAIDTPADDMAQDRLVQEIVRIQKLVRAQKLRAKDPDSMPADGDLHLFAGYLSAAWLNRLMRLETWERQNLAAFTARLVAAGVDAPDVAWCAVYVLGETLETRRPLQSTKDDKNDASVADLLPAAVALFEFAGHKLALFSNGEKKISGRQGRLAAVGHLAWDAGVKPGFSTRRWHFWYKQLRKLSSADNKGVREQAREGLESMDLWNDWVG